MLTRLIVVIILQYIQILNHYIVHLKVTQYYMSVISQFKKREKNISNKILEKYTNCVNMNHGKVRFIPAMQNNAFIKSLSYVCMLYTELMTINS